MSNGDLLTYLKSDKNTLDMKQMTDFALQIALGMEYLAERKFVHRDLAARNCILDENFVVKVSDFGLTRDIFEQDCYRVKNAKNALPKWWLAPESVRWLEFTSKSDVWSFGITCWEIMTKGMVPYDGMSEDDLMNQWEAGKRLEIPADCPKGCNDIMQRCWRLEANYRPTFNYIVVELKQIVSKV